MIPLRLVFRLQKPLVTAASALVRLGENFYLVADDEHFLMQFDLQGRTQVYPLLPDSLPETKAERKKRKADFESLLVLDNERLLALPSGSTDQRQRAVEFNLRTQEASILDYSDFFSTLSTKLTEINIEGALLFNNELILFQRGNGSLAQNGTVRLPQPENWSALGNECHFQAIDLGAIKNCSYTFTDACVYRGNFIFTAVAEASGSTYEDGANLGAVLGIMTPEGKLLDRQRLPPGIKPEGLCVDETNQTFYLVTDDDDRTKPSGFYSGSIPSEWER